MNPQVLSTSIQCFTFVITSIYLLCNTSYSMPYFLAFTSLILSVLSIQLLIGLYERGPFKDNYNGIIKILNDDILLSGVTLYIGLFLNVFINYADSIYSLLFLMLFVYTVNKIVWYFKIQN